MTLKAKDPSAFVSLPRERHFDDVREKGFREIRHPAFLPLDNRPENRFYVEAAKS